MKSIIINAFAVLNLLPLSATAETYVVASQNIPYYPHYEFAAPKDKGFAWALLEAYAAEAGATAAAGDAAAPANSCS